jgi:hypothetical protein
MTPIPSLIILGVLSVLMLYVTDVFVLINYLAFSESSVVAMSILALVTLRFTRPDLPRPIKVRALDASIPMILKGSCCDQ